MCKCVCACRRMTFPSAEIRSFERSGMTEVIYAGIVPRLNVASLAIQSGTDYTL